MKFDVRRNGGTASGVQELSKSDINFMSQGVVLKTSQSRLLIKHRLHVSFYGLTKTY